MKTRGYDWLIQSSLILTVCTSQLLFILRKRLVKR